MWPCKKEKPEIERIYIPAEHVEKVLELFDAYYAAPEGQDRVARYHLWRKIYSCLNISHDCGVNYTLQAKDSLRPYIVRIDET